MARYIGPKTKISRKFGEPVIGAGKALQKKNYPPGMHGKSKKRKGSEYAVQLNEKQKAKYLYGVLERQFAKIFNYAARKDGVTGDNLLKFLEARLDNTVYRFGLAPTRRAARQLVLHKHITVNGEVINIPSKLLKPGDIVAVRERSKSLETIADSLATKNSKRFPWLEWDSANLTGKFVNYPQREEIPENINVQLIVELYSK
jgi:small subunit ribosomal protein S4